MKKLWQMWVNAQRIGCLIIGPLFIALAIIWTIHILWFKHHALLAQGVVTKVLHRQDDDGNTVYAPVFQFQSSDGRTISIQSSIWTSPAYFERDDKVPVIYAQNNPSDARIEAFSQLWLMQLIFGMGGVVSLLIGLWLQARYKKRKQATNSAFVTAGMNETRHV